MKPKLPRVPLPRQRGGAHRVRRELSAREELVFELNAMEANKGVTMSESPLTERLRETRRDLILRHDSNRSAGLPLDRADVNAILKMLDEAADEAASTGWQPIETAPKDGTRVFVYGWQCGVSLFGVGHWFQPRTIKELGGWICHTLPLHEFVNGTFTEPTHWIPLPKAPGVDGGALPASEAKHTGKAKEIESLSARLAAAEAALRDAIDGYADAIQYKSEYLVKKHGDKEEIERLRAALSPTPEAK